MSFIQKFTVILASVLFSTVVFAAGAPSNVQRVFVNMHQGTLTATWGAVDGAAYYRIYYSHTSILDHGGDYDDMDRTQGKETAYAFKTLPYTSGKAFVAVLAVDQHGVESEGFETEASVDLGGTAAPAASSPTSVSTSPSIAANEPIPSVTSIPMAVTSVQAVSQTGVLITFTKALPIGNVFPPTFFMVSDGSGVILESGSGVIVGSGTTILVTTSKQELQKSYFLNILQPVPALDGTNLPTSPTRMPFAGFMERMQSSVSSVASSSSSEIPYVRNPMLPLEPTIAEEPPVKEQPKTNLPKSGIGLFGIATLSGILAGRRMKRRK